MINKVRKTHKWLMAFIGLQFLIWSLTGLYMVTMDIHFIHGETLIQKRAAAPDLSKVDYSFNALLSDYPNANAVRLGEYMGTPVYRFVDADKGKLVIDAQSGERLPLVDEQTAVQLAQRYFNGISTVNSVQLISEGDPIPSELAPRHIPVWRITFDGMASPTLYISQHSGEVVTKRHTFWRAFDWMWRFHIMDYDDGENVSNWFLLIIGMLGTVAALSGATLTYHRFTDAKKERAM
ncbi:PepSY domain-containing protein [Aestuariibacter salexigens]|uniref:PepSY domain-containing protein n=1 Tax=Aestuariibacter salexigens TaxID=226010 RepID=UPI000405E375|nr:PepSY domain-containing protein [Aestuariibacter salexigens]